MDDVVPPPVEDDEVVLVPEPLAELPLDPPALRIPLAVLLNTLVVAVLRAFIPAATLPTSKSKRTAYSGADTPVSSSAMRRNILAPEAADYANWPRSSSPLEKAMFVHIVSRLIERSVDLLTVTDKAGLRPVRFRMMYSRRSKSSGKKARNADSGLG